MQLKLKRRPKPKKLTQPRLPTQDKNLTKVYLIRHAQVRNPARLNYGSLPGFHLSRTGVAQARRLGRLLRPSGISAIYTSPLERARETADLVASLLPGRVPVHVRDELTESAVWVSWQGWPVRSLPLRFPRQYLGWSRHPERVRFAETSVQEAERIDRVVEEARTHHQGESVLVISHGGPIRNWFFWREDRPWSRAFLTPIRPAEGYLATCTRRRIEQIDPFRLPRT